ncbi:MAG: DUF6596 domain-containing protein [Bacteroidota bacterium]
MSGAEGQKLDLSWNMKNSTTSVIESSFRTYYGKLFAALFSQFGAAYVNEIEDAVQNAFYKALKTWKPNQIPIQQENWLYIVAKNDLLNQLRKRARTAAPTSFIMEETSMALQEDLRLKTILLLSKSKKVTAKVKVLFILKNIFGLHVKEISESTLLSQDAVYKSISRAKSSLGEELQNSALDTVFEQATASEIHLVEEILYAVFNIGFDSFSEKVQLIINEDLCLEALALGKMLTQEFEQISSKNLLSLFCFHLARIPAKIKNGKLISFFEQQKSDWNSDLLKLGFHYLEQPSVLNKYYLEALIASKHMTAEDRNIQHWNEIIQLYELLLPFSDSPMLKLNLCYCLSKVNRTVEAKELLDNIEQVLPKDYPYFSLVKAAILKEKESAQSLVAQALKHIHQDIRRTYILEYLSSDD